MSLFVSTLNQMGVLGFYMIIGFVIAKLGIVDRKSTALLSKLENNVFLPALVLYTFIENFNISSLSQSWKLLLFSLGTELAIIPIAIASARLASEDGFVRRMYTYGLSFSNFGFMGNAVVQALFSPAFYQSYIIFTLPLWTLIYIWEVPGLLIERDAAAPMQTCKEKFSKTIKPFINPMFIALLIGAVIGISGAGKFLLSLNGGKGIFLTQVIKVCGDCMSPIAMIMTGITFAFIDIKKVLADKSIYIVTALRLIVYPLVFGTIAWLFRNYVIAFDDAIFKCFVISLAMPLGLNTIVIPAAYGRDTSVPAGMALVSHSLSIATIPLVMMIFGIG
jgi:predicted permease